MSGTRSRGSQFGLYMAAIARAELMDEIRPLVSPQLRQLMDRPPLATAWIEVAVLDELLEAVFELGGQEKLDIVVEEFSRLSIHDQLGSLFRLELTMGNNQPDTFLSRINSIIGVVMAGTTIAFEPTDATSGRFIVSYSAPVSLVRLRGWRGVLRTLLDVLDASTVIGPEEIAPSLDRVSFDLNWIPSDAKR